MTMETKHYDNDEIDEDMGDDKTYDDDNKNDDIDNNTDEKLYWYRIYQYSQKKIEVETKWMVYGTNSQLTSSLYNTVLWRVHS